MLKLRPLRSLLLDAPVGAKMAFAPVMILFLLLATVGGTSWLLYKEVAALDRIQQAQSVVREAADIAERLSDIHARLYRLSVRATSTSNIVQPTGAELERMRADIFELFVILTHRQTELFGRTGEAAAGLSGFTDLQILTASYREVAERAAETATLGSPEALRLVEEADQEYARARALAEQLSATQTYVAERTYQRMITEAERAVIQFLIVAVLVVAVTAPLAILIASRTISRIKGLAATIERFTHDSGAPMGLGELTSGVFKHPGKDELGVLIVTFRAMAIHIQEHIRLIRRKNEEAERAYRELRDAQNNLIEAEKLAALGGLVAGVAHEVNTPVGLTLTGATHLRERTETLAKLFEAGKMKKSDFKSFVDTARQSAEMIYGNATRASELIASFKEVAVDQTSEERRRFLLKSYVDEILLSLRPRLKRTRHTVTVEIAGDLEMDSYPGAISQIVTNFIMNSLIHGFDDQEQGDIRLTASMAEPGRVRLVYRDDGRGMNDEQVRHAFEPFYTTKRGSGGSGLGLHIVYNLATAKLGGRITLDSAPGEGVAFTLDLPCRLGAARPDGIEQDQSNEQYDAAVG